MDHLKQAILRRIYSAHAEWANRFPFACGPGCSICCTSSVTMTTMEAAELVDYLEQSGKWRAVGAVLDRLGPSGVRPAETFNQFAARCLARHQTENDGEIPWDMSPCRFLDNHARCTVYPARPFACRSMASSFRCEPGGEAEIAPLLLTINTVVMQLIEHFDSGGGYWGNMIDILRMQVPPIPSHLTGEVLAAHPLPGFLVPPGEETEVEDFLTTLFQSEVLGHRFDSLMEKIGPGGTIDNGLGME